MTQQSKSRANRERVTAIGALKIVILLTALAGGTRAAQADPVEPLFLSLGQTRTAGLAEPTVMRERTVELAGTEFGASVRLNLFDDVDLQFDKVTLRANDLGGKVWQGVTRDGHEGKVFLSSVGQAVAGNIWYDGKQYELRYRGNGRHVVSEFDPSKLEPDGCGEHDHPEPDFEERLIESIAAQRGQGDPAQVVDLMVLYTPLAETRQGGAEGIEALIHLAIGVSNEANEGSDVITRYSPVYIGKIDYVEAAIEPAQGDDDPNVFDDRNRLRIPDDGFMDDAHALRETYCADIVHLVTGAGGGWCGAAYIMNTPQDAGHEDRAFAVTKDTCAVGGLTFIHEMGHTAGAQHDWYVDDSTDPYVYAHGYVDLDDNFRTIMAYGTECSDVGVSCARIARWSNPNKFFNGQPIGVAEGTDDSCVEESLSNPDCDAENWKVLNNNASTVANFRQRSQCTQSSARNVWMKDTWADTGVEPDPLTAGQSMWKSPYIWVRNSPDTTGEFQHIHQNPEFGSTNYVYVKLHNDFGVASQGQLKLYYAEASTGLTWPGDWTQFANVNLNIAAHATLLQPATWSPPGTGHFCLLARWDTPNNPVDPMTFPEGAVIGDNVRNNNNIVWRNLNVIDLDPNLPFAFPDFKVNNPSTADPFTTLAVNLNPNPTGPGYQGQLWLDLGSAYDSWIAAGGIGSGIRPVNLPGFGDVVEILPGSTGPATLDRLQIPAGQPVSMRLIAEADPLPLLPNAPDVDDEPGRTAADAAGGSQLFDAGSYAVDVIQFQGGVEIGGVGYEIRMRSGTSGVGAVPDGARVPGTPLLLDKSPSGALRLEWQASCLASDADYAVYAGSLGAWTSHLPLDCSTGGSTDREYPLPGQSLYYLVVPTDGIADGSYGFDSTGAERPESPEACRLQVATTCPLP